MSDKSDRENSPDQYAAIVASALRSELGHSHRAAKTLMRWTGASEGAVKHWLSGLHGPNGDHLTAIIRESNAVLEAVLAAAGRRDIMMAAQILNAQGTVFDVIAMVEAEWPGHAGGGGHAFNPQKLSQGISKCDRVSVPINDRIVDPENLAPGSYLNIRQNWYLEALSLGKKVTANDIKQRWSISEKTARRDLAKLKALGLISFVGPSKTGRYQLRE